jgi:error-prone DNA polymerase
MKFVKGLRREVAERIARERRAGGPFESTEDLALRTDLRRDELETLASLGALASLGLSRRQALWQAARVSREAGPLFAELPDETPSPLPEMSPIEETTADFRSSAVTVGPHPVAHLRPSLKKLGVLRAVDLDRFPSGAKVKIAGSVIVRQRPGTAKGILFVTLEDETGMSQAVISAELLQQHRAVIVGSPGLIVEGTLQKRDGAVAIKAETFRPLVETATGKSHDFR